MDAADPAPMCVRWWSVGEEHSGLAGLFGLVYSSLRYPGLDGEYVALYGPSPVPRARAIAMAEVSDLPSWRGRACGTLAGEVVTFEHDGRSVALRLRGRTSDARLAPRW